MSRTLITSCRRLAWQKPRFARALMMGTCTACLGTVQAAADHLPQPAPPILDYTTLDFEDNQTFLTGIRGDTIVGNFIIPDTSATGGLLYDSHNEIWSPFPFATPDMTNYPGSSSSSPYGPSFGSYGGILRVVGSYKTDASPFDLGYLYDGAATPGNELLTLAYPDPSTAFTIAHSTFGNLVVGNYDTGPLTGNAFIYDIAAGTYTTNNIPGEASTTAYGVWGDKIAGGYGGFSPDGEPGFEHGYIYDISTDSFTTHNHPGAFFTHFEGITGAGRGGEYNLVVDWIGPDGLHAAVLHIDALGHETWIPIEFPGAITTSANSIHQDRVIGVYTDADGVHGFEVTIPGIYNPIHNAATIVTDASNTTVFEAGPGDDVVNDGSITTTGAFANAIRNDRYGVIYNNGEVSVSGQASGAAVLRGDFPSLLNAGTLRAAPAGDAVRADANSFGTLVVNTGIIDGRIDVRSGTQARFENSGLIGLSGAGAGVSSVISGVFVQTAAGVFAPRIQGDSTDTLAVLGTARLDGVLAPMFQPGDFETSYAVLSASDALTGEFATLAASGLPDFLTPSIDYTDTQVIVDLEAELAQVAGLSRNQRAVGDALDDAFNSGGGIPDGLNGALFGLTNTELGQALDALSGELHASTRSVLVEDAFLARQAVLGRLRQTGHDGVLGLQGGLAAAAVSAVEPAADYGPIPVPRHMQRGPAFWVQGFGAWAEFDGDSNVSELQSTHGSIFGGADIAVGANGVVGLAGGYSQADIDIDDLASSAEVDTAWIAGYAGTSVGPWKLRAGGAFGFHSIDAERTIEFPGFADHASADYDAGTGQLFGEIGYAAAWRGIDVEPFGGLAWVHVDTDGFDESDGPAALRAASETWDVGYSTLGLRAAMHYPLANGVIITPRLSAAWQHGFGDLTPAASLAFAQTTNAEFAVTGVPLAGDSALIDAGLDVAISPQARFGVSYFGQLGDSNTTNAFRGHFTWTF